MKPETLTKFVELLVGNDAWLSPDELNVAEEMNFNDHLLIDEQEGTDLKSVMIDTTYLSLKDEMMDDIIFVGRMVHGLWGLNSLMDFVKIIIDANTDVLTNSFEEISEAQKNLKIDILNKIQQEEKVV